MGTPDKSNATKDLAKKMLENLEDAQERAVEIEEKRTARERKVEPSKFSPEGPAIAPGEKD